MFAMHESTHRFVCRSGCYLFSLLPTLLVCVWVGCRSDTDRIAVLADGPGPPPAPKRPFRFKETTAPQHAIFFATTRYGDFGDPVLKPGSLRTLQVNGTSVYLSHDARRLLCEKTGSALDMTLVEARVHLESEFRTQSVYPPRTESVYTLVIDELIDVKPYAPNAL
jgi:hypothetical protein